MKIFISWSESRSKALAEALRDWIPDVLQACEPWISSEDIDPGARWSLDLARQLDEIQFGIICLTPENLSAPWIYFEAGAISKKISDKTRVCPYLLDLGPTDITGPLTQFQAAKANRDDTKKLMQAINVTSASQALSDERFNRLFDIHWPRLEEVIKKIPGKTPAAKQPARKEKDMIEETLRTVREQSRKLSELSNDMQYFFDNFYNISTISKGSNNLCNEQKTVSYKSSFTDKSFVPMQSDIITKNDILRLNSDKSMSVVLNILKESATSLNFDDLKRLTGLSEKSLSNSLIFLRDKHIVSKNDANRTYEISNDKFNPLRTLIQTKNIKKAAKKTKNAREIKPPAQKIESSAKPADRMEEFLLH